MSSGSKKPPFLRQSSYNSLYVNPLVEPKRHGRSCSEGVAAVVPLGDCLNLNRTPLASTDHNKGSNNNNVVVLDKRENPGMGDKENAVPATESFAMTQKFATLKSKSTGRANPEMGDKENAVPAAGSFATEKKFATLKSMSTGRALKPTSLEYCMQMNDPKLPFGSKTWDVSVGSEKSNSVNIWDYSDSEAAPASSWATLPNRALLCRPLPLDVGRCTCVIVKEATPEGLNGGALYSLYTNEGKGRQDRKLAVAHHKQHKGRSEFTIAQTTKGLLSCSDDSYIGTVTANFMGSKYHIWDQGSNLNSLGRKCKPVLAVVRFMPTIATWTGSYRSMSVYVPKHQSMQLRSSTTQVQHINGLPKDWEDRKDRVHQLCSRVPHYNKISNQYELDYRDRGRTGLQIQKSVKNFQLTLEASGKQTILQLGRVEKSKYVMDYRYPLTGYQAFCICLASIDSKLCCTI